MIAQAHFDNQVFSEYLFFESEIGREMSGEYSVNPTPVWKEVQEVLEVGEGLVVEFPR